MASFDEDNLREEEIQGGFEPGQAEDDSFMLENQEGYPGKLPDFDSEDEPKVIVDNEEVKESDSPENTETPEEASSADEDIPSEDVDMAEQIDLPTEGGSVWDSFDDADTSGTEESADETDDEGLIPKQEEYVVKPKEDDTSEEVVEPAEEVTEDVAEEPVAEEVTEEVVEEIAEETPGEPEPADVEADNAEIEIPEGIEDLILPHETPAEETEEISDVASDKVGDDKEETTEINETTEQDTKSVETSKTEATVEPEESVEQDKEGVLDDDFKKALADDIEKSKARKEEAKSKESAEDEPEEMKTEEFTPVDDHEETQLIDINEIEADKPSNYGLQKDIEPADQPKTEEMKIADNAVGPEAAPEEGGVKLKKKKKRKPLPFKKRIALIALITFFGTAAAFVGYNYVYKNNEGIISYFESFTGSEQDAKAHEENNVVAGSGKEANKEANKEAQKPVTKDTIEVIAKDAGNEAEEMAVTDKPKEKQVVKQKTAKKKYVASAPKKTSQDQTQKKYLKQKSVREYDIAELPAEIKPEKPASKKKSSTKLPELSLPKSDKGLFTIQIYASPSREDAEEWLDKLRNKNIRDSFISKHKIRDEIWYRVRFGKFETQKEARTTALKYGFAQTWIDRVR